MLCGRLRKPKCPVGTNVDLVAIFQKPARGIPTLHSDKVFVNIGSIGGIEVLAINQWVNFRLLLVVVDDRINAKVQLRDMYIGDRVVPDTVSET